MKKALLIGVPFVLLLSGATVGLAFIGAVKIPFLPFKKKGAKPFKDDGRGGPFARIVGAASYLARQVEEEAAVVKARVPPPPPVPPMDPEPGEKKLASLWAEMPTDRLVALVAKWPEPKLGRILTNMNAEAVTNLLSALPPTRAASLSRAVAAATDERAAKVHTNDEN